MNYMFLGWILKVRVWDPWVRERRREVEREEKEKNERKRVASLLYKRLNRVDPNPVHSLLFSAV